MMTLDDDYDFTPAPRGRPIKELVGASFTLTNPRNRLILNEARKVNYGFAVGELCWYVRGDTDLATMMYYNRRMAQFSDDGETINSAYGSRMFKDRFPALRFTGMGRELEDRSQLDNVLDELTKDPDSRRAVMHINEPSDLDKATTRGSKDVPCTISIQLLIRNRRLHMVVNMRSNDVVWGLPYDVFSFTCLQEAFLYMLQEHGVPVDDLGSYHHHAGSLHVYDTHFEMVKDVTAEDDRDVTPMTPFTLEGLRWLAYHAEPMIRGHIRSSTIDWRSIPQNPDSCLLGSNDSSKTTIEWMLERLIDHRDKRCLEQERALKELVRLTEEIGGYQEFEREKK
jgi:thymidylate synthase